MVKSHNLTTPSSPPETTQRPSGENAICRTPFVWPLYVWMHDFRRISQIFKFVSTDPDAKNSPYGCHCTLTQLDRWPVSVRATLACSRSHSLRVTPADPAMTVCSFESKLTHSTALVCPARLWSSACTGNRLLETEAGSRTAGMGWASSERAGHHDSVRLPDGPHVDFLVITACGHYGA